MNRGIILLLGILSVVSGVLTDDCPSFFNDGVDGSCTVRQCLNGGFLDDASQTCICPSGYLGIHCEAVKTSMPPDNHFKAGGTSFNIININLYTQYWGFKTYENIKEGLDIHLNSYPNGYDYYNLLETTGKPYLDSSDQEVFGSYNFKPISSSTPFTLASWTDTGLYWCYEVPIFEQLIQMIQQKNLKNTVITILTQHPPSNDKHDEAREISVSFGIRVNVLWIKDDTFNRCANEKIAQFKTFVDITGGLFVQLQSELNDSSTVNLVSQVFLTHYKPQYVSIQSFSDCSTPQQVPVVTDPTVNGPYNFVFLGDNAKPGIDGFRTCSLLQPLRSVDNELAIFQSLNPMCSSITIQSSNDSCTAIIFTNANATVGPLDLAIYVTYVEDQSIDASRYAIVEGVPFYPAFHIESSSGASTTLNYISASFDMDWRVTPQKRSPATFEWISDKTIQCDASQTYSLYLNITVGDTNVRAVRVACVPAPIATTVSVVSTTAVPTSIPTTVLTTSSPAPIITSTDSSSSSSTGSSVTPSTCPYTQNYATFLFAYAADFNPTTYGMVSRTIGNLIKKNFPNNQTLANKLIDMESPQNINYTNNIVSFTTSCDVDIPNATLAATDIKASDALDTIKSFLNDVHSGRLEGSVVFILLNRLPKDLSSSENDLSTDDYDKLTNLNIKVFPIISISSLAKGALAGRSGAVFNKIAAQTNGHYVIADDSIGPDTNSDYNKIVSNFMNTAYNQNLLFTRNVGVNRIGTNLGVVRIPTSATGSPNITVTITVSLSAVDAHQPQPPSKLVLGIKPNPKFSNTKGILIDFNKLPNQFSNSNYYTTTVELEAGIDRELVLQYVAGSDNNDLLIRMWAAGDAFRQATYMNYDESAKLHFTNVTTIKEDFGAALQFQFSGACSDNKKATLLITDCNGVVSAKYDSDQMASTSSVFYQFIPFFCSSQPTPATCISGAESKYDAQFVSDSFSITQSFQCRPGAGPFDTCNLTDANGNNQCSGTSPFKRGPHANLYDCSNHGHLEHNDTTELFRCKCDDENFSGESCEIATCSTKNSDPLATDNNYHTYTVVVGLDQANGFLPLDDAQELFGSLDSLSHVWKYQLLTVCADGKYDMLYSGSDLKNFKDMFNDTNYLKVARPCNTPAQAGVHDLTDIYKQSVKGIGRNVKGIVVYFSEVSEMIKVTLDDFITASQPYQQQLFVYALDDGNEIRPLTVGGTIVKAAMSTGGFLIQSFINNDSDPLDKIDKTFLPALLSSSSSISWMSTAQNSDFSISTSSSNVTSYLITYETGLDLYNQNCLNNPNWICKYSGNTATMGRTNGTTTVIGRVDEGPYYVAVYSLNDALAPKAQIISDLGKDSSDAVSTSSSDARTIMGIMLNDNYNIVANSGDGGITRNAQRTGCTFGWTSYSVFSTKKYETGVNIAKITIEGPGSETYTRFFPFGTSSAPACHNGGTPITSTGSCDCPPNFQGPDCSLVYCFGSSKPNAWSDVCICANIDDVVCANQYTSVF